MCTTVTGRSLLLFAALTSGEPVKVIRRLALDVFDWRSLSVADDARMRTN